MSITLNPYLSFQGTAKEAMEFYRSVLGGDFTSMTFAEGGMPVEPQEAELLMHGQLVTPIGITLMGADSPASMPYTPGTTIAVSISGDDAETLAAYWEGLSEGGTVTMPFELAPWGDRFGMFTDRYGIDWMINSVGEVSS